MKLVSIIIPVYQVEAYIAATIKSVLSQTHQDFEILIVDDGSVDKSREICQRFQDSRIKIIVQENRGVSAARNQGIRAAKGEILAFLDGDDLWLPEKLEKHINHLATATKVGISFSRLAFIDESGEFLGLFKMSRINGLTPAMILSRNPVGNPSCVVIRRETLEAIKFVKQNASESQLDCYFDENLNHFEDVELWLRVACKTDWEIAGIPEALTLYRINPQGASVNFDRQLDDVSKMLQKIAAYAPDLSRQYGEVLKAYTWRKFAQRAVSQREGLTAKTTIDKALATHRSIAIEEPLRTLTILAASYCLYLLPRSIYLKIETLALKITGAIQKIILPKSQTDTR